jgi:hypothetical protein
LIVRQLSTRASFSYALSQAKERAIVRSKEIARSPNAKRTGVVLLAIAAGALAYAVVRRQSRRR